MSEIHRNKETSAPMTDFVLGHLITDSNKSRYELELCRSENHGFYIREIRAGKRSTNLTEPDHYQSAYDQYCELVAALHESGYVVKEKEVQPIETTPSLISPLKIWHAEKWLQDDSIYFQAVPVGKRCLLQIGADGEFMHTEDDHQHPISRNTQNLIAQIKTAGVSEITLEVIAQNQKIYVLDILRLNGENLGIRSGLKRLLRLSNLESLLCPMVEGLKFIRPLMSTSEKKEGLRQLADKQHHRLIARSVNACHLFRLIQPAF